MRDTHLRELAVQAVTERDRLYKLISKSEKHRDGSQAAEQALLDLRRQYTEAGEQIERVKAVMRTEEERIRQKTAEALRLKTEWKQQQFFGSFSDPVNSSDFPFMTALVSPLLFMGAVACLLLWLR